MTPSGPGERQCARCHRQIVDFRGMSAEDVALRHVQSEAPVCGVYSPAQLARTDASRGSGNPRRDLPLAMAAWLLGSASAGAQEVAPPSANHAVLPPPPGAAQSAPAQALEQQAESPAPLDTLTVRGTVRDGETGRPVPGAVVWAQGTALRTVTDARGEYVLHLGATAGEKRPGTLVFMLIGYARKELRLPEGRDPVVDVSLSAERVELTAFVVTARRPSLWSRVRGAVGSIF